MPRSFLVKKASSTRVPDYGQLHSRAHEVIGSSSGWRPSSGGQALPAPLQTEDAPPSAPCEAARLWDRGAILARLSLPLPLEGEAKGTPGPSPPSPDVSPADAPTGTPLRDNQNDLNRLSLPRRRVPELGSPAEGSKATPDKLVGAPGEIPPRLGCCDCRASYPAVCRHRELPPRKSFACKHCDKEYASLGALKMHIRTHTLPCLCKICGKAFSRPWLLQGHIRTHTDPLGRQEVPVPGLCQDLLPHVPAGAARRGRLLPGVLMRPPGAAPSSRGQSNQLPVPCQAIEGKAHAMGIFSHMHRGGLAVLPGTHIAARCGGICGCPRMESRQLASNAFQQAVRQDRSVLLAGLRSPLLPCALQLARRASRLPVQLSGAA
ncbi:zinc finger protein SNAI3 isoform X1 [Alligator sinensis]|uniref:Zinc finger protein SNAI2 n=1 Tax=Alligator sinensis TaxID=38654 RepID=A0A3Q0GZS3_ALLSI|nr:zinc finger protein SNAI3 isoform X1 [Alligator sinensis]